MPGGVGAGDGEEYGVPVNAPDPPDGVNTGGANAGATFAKYSVRCAVGIPVAPFCG